MSQVVSCSRCGTQVPEDQTTFSPAGDFLCPRCTDAAELQQQLDRAREEALAKASSEQGVDWIIARARAKDDHAKLVAQVNQTLRAPGAPAADPSQPARCARCEAATVHGELLYDAAGRLVCARCEAGDKLRAAEEEVAGSFGLGFAAGLLASVIGVAAAHGMGKARTRKGAMVGFGVELLAGAAVLAWIAFR